MAAVRRIPPLPTVREIVKIYKLRGVKKLSQNFLLDPKILNRIINTAATKGKLTGAYVCEVGPGPGSLTRSILEKGAEHVVVVEKDRRCLPVLEMLKDACEGAMTIHHDDILRFDTSNMFPNEAASPWDGPVPRIHLIGNLPFNISTPLIIKWLKQISEKSGLWTCGRVGMTLTFQKEVGERMVADVSEKKKRSRLSIMTQYLCDVKLCFTIKGHAFVPKPDVDVAVMRFTPKKKPLIDAPFPVVEKVVRHVFHYRQKYCKHGLQTLFPLDKPDYTLRLLEESGVNPKTVSFNLAMEEFDRLCVVYKKICDENPGLIDYNYRSVVNVKEWKTRKAKLLDAEEESTASDQ